MSTVEKLARELREMQTILNKFSMAILNANSSTSPNYLIANINYNNRQKVIDNLQSRLNELSIEINSGIVKIEDQNSK